jgi:hypothetical protein
MTPTDALGHDLLTAYSQLLVHRARRRRTAVVSTVAVAGMLVLGTAALGAAHLLGWPAPEHVRKDIAAVDRGLPEDLRLNPDVEHARAVAATANGTLYAASLKDGGSCTEIVTAGERSRGATCSTAADREQEPIGLVAPFDDGAGPNAPIVLGGRVNDPDASSLEAVYGDGTHEQVALGDDRYYLLEVPADQRASVHESGVELVARNHGGSIVARATLPADWDDAAVPDDQAPLYVSTRSDESDFTKVYGLEGHVGVHGAARLVLDYGDGTRVAIPILSDGRFEYAVPPERRGDFMTPRVVDVLDAKGNTVASTTVAAVAYWRSRQP